MNTKSETPIKSALPLPTDWQAMQWRKAEKYVEKLQKRIFHAEKNGNKRRVNYVCPICKRSITDFKEGLEIHHIISKHHGGNGEYKNLQLVHISCHIEYHKAFPVKAEIPPKAKVNAWLKWYRRSIG